MCETRLIFVTVCAVWLAGCGLSWFGASKRLPSGPAHVRVARDDRGEWQLLVNGTPTLVRGMSYTVSALGETPDHPATWVDWAYSDRDHNGKPDGPYDAWIDENRNDEQDDTEPAIGDFRLMSNMGVNTIRWYHNAYPNWTPNKDVLRDAYWDYGIRIAVGDLLGAYGIGSGVPAGQETDYRNPYQRQRMLESVRRMVLDHRAESYVLCWLLGSENNWHQTRTNAVAYPDVYARFVDEAARLIHQLDGKHPVVFVNGDIGLLREVARFCPDVDILGVTLSVQESALPFVWEGVRRVFDRPVLITGYGGLQGQGYDEDAQASYHRTCWHGVEANRAGHGGAGNAIGAIAADWVDRWWAAGEPNQHARRGEDGSQGGFVVPWEVEYAGICSQGDGRHSPFLRQLRKVYEVYQRELWADR